MAGLRDSIGKRRWPRCDTARTSPVELQGTAAGGPAVDGVLQTGTSDKEFCGIKLTRSDMNYWIVRGKPRVNDWDNFLKPGRRITWHTAQRPRKLHDGDRVFFWESSPNLRIVGLGKIYRAEAGVADNGHSLFCVEHTTARLTHMPTIRELRPISGLENASFLKIGPARTVLSITNDEAEHLIHLLKQHNPELQNIWVNTEEQHTVREEAGLVDVDLIATEGKQRLVQHLRRERKRSLVEAKKALILRKNGRLACDCCGFDFKVIYGGLGEGFCEVHHKRPLSQSKAETKTKLSDMAVVCSNCHRVIHRSQPMITIEKLRRLIRCVKEQ